MNDWKAVTWKKRPESYGREPAMSKEVSPCSEYTRFTAEGRLKDPHSDSSVILDGDLVGYLFRMAPFSEPKWSDRLGYGMAVIGEDTRVHLHANGKYVIRRAMDRQHAQETYLALASISQPALFSSVNKSFLWEIVRDHALSFDSSRYISVEELMSWPDESSGNDILLRATEVFKEADENNSSMFAKSLESGSIQDPKELFEELVGLKEGLSSSLSSIFDRSVNTDRGGILGWGSYILFLRAAMELS
jgi:hypothetical protein